MARSPRSCPGCGSDRSVPFFELPEVPSNSCILLDSAEEALACARGRLLLCFCEDCGFIGNHAFEPTLTEYSERYEETQGFSPTFTRCEVSYGGQHLGVIARPGEATRGSVELEGLGRLALDFAGRSAEGAREWCERLERAAARGERVVLWGSGSKSTAFLTSLGILEGVAQVVDINPHRQGRFMAGTGQPIVAPGALLETPPEHVIIMNPIYRQAIGRTLAQLGLAPQLHDLTGV